MRRLLAIETNRLVWFGFKVKSPSRRFKPKAQAILLTQYKQIQKNAKNKGCSPSPFWRINVQSDGKTSFKETNEKNERQHKNIPNFITDTWTKIKVGIYFTEKERGWLKAYVGDRLVYSHKGRTIMNHFKNCTPIRLDNYLRIGVYRGSDKKSLVVKRLKKTSQTLCILMTL